MNHLINCDYCGVSSSIEPVFEKPARVVYDGFPILLVQGHMSLAVNKIQDTICAKCLCEDLRQEKQKLM